MRAKRSQKSARCGSPSRRRSLVRQAPGRDYSASTKVTFSRTRYSAILPLATTTSWLATQAPATFFRVLVARFTPFSSASSKLFLDEAMISVTLATDDMFGPPLSPVMLEPKHPDRDMQKGAIRSLSDRLPGTGVQHPASLP